MPKPRYWWSTLPGERYWCEITDRNKVGEDLICPQTNESGKSYWSYSLILDIRPGDVVFHYYTPAKAFVGASIATGTCVPQKLCPALETPNFARYSCHASFRSVFRDRRRPGNDRSRWSRASGIGEPDRGMKRRSLRLIRASRCTGRESLIRQERHHKLNEARYSFLRIFGDDPFSTILPVTPPLPSNSCACLASARGNRCAIRGLIFCC